MSIFFIFAQDSNGCIGKSDGSLPWEKILADRAHFRSVTMKKPDTAIIMGRKTFESIGSKPLGGRVNFVLSRDTTFTIPKVVVINDPNFVREFSKKEDVFIIGGAELYREFYPDVVRMYVTNVEGDFGGDYGDVYFPPYSYHDWKEVSRTIVGKGISTPYNLEFLILDRA